MAEYMLEKLIEKSAELNEENWEILSAGISAIRGNQINDKAKSVMAELNLDLSKHDSQNIDDLELRKKDLIITMTSKHSRALILKHPDLADKIFILKEFSEKEAEDSKDIEDPFGLSEDFYRKTRDEIRENLKAMLDKLIEFDFKEED